MKKSQILFAMVLCLVTIFSVNALARPPRSEKGPAKLEIVEKIKSKREAQTPPKEKHPERRLKVLELKHKK